MGTLDPEIRKQPSRTVHACGPSTREAEAEEWRGVQGQMGYLNQLQDCLNKNKKE